MMKCYKLIYEWLNEWLSNNSIPQMLNLGQNKPVLEIRDLNNIVMEIWRSNIHIYLF
jgi:hypothetical protein